MAPLDQLLLKTSRTFALSIPVLPEPTRREVAIAYLLFRIADTLEDATRWSSGKQIAELARFDRLLASLSPEEARSLAAEWLDDPPLEHDGYLELLSQTPDVLADLRELSDEARSLICAHTQRTARKMADFVERAGEGLRTIEDLRSYCYAVAGIVGEMLTELFLLRQPALQPVAAELRRDAATFGEALQLVNILKDSATDQCEGRSYLPAEVDRDEVFALARGDLDVAGQYVARLQSADAPRGLVEFAALPVLLAWASLDRVESHGAGSKLTRPEVMRIVQDLNDALDHARPAISRPVRSA